MSRKWRCAVASVGVMLLRHVSCLASHGARRSRPAGADAVSRDFRRRYERLADLLDLLPQPVEAFADVGCDHAYLAAAASMTGRASRCIGVDAAEQALRSAHQRLSGLRGAGGASWPLLLPERWGEDEGTAAPGARQGAEGGALPATLELRVGDGARALRAGELLGDAGGAQGARGALATAGVGVPTMVEGMLLGAVECGAGWLLLQPVASKIWQLRRLRKTLADCGWTIEAEALTGGARGSEGGAERFVVSICARRADDAAVDPFSDPAQPAASAGSEEEERRLLLGNFLGAGAGASADAYLRYVEAQIRAVESRIESSEPHREEEATAELERLWQRLLGEERRRLRPAP